MKHSVINLAEFTRIFAVSNEKFTDAEAISNWIKSCGVPLDACIDFIGPSAIHYAVQTALRLGQSFNKSGKILFINIDNSESINSFIERTQCFQRAEMDYTTITPIEDTTLFKIAGVSTTTFKLIHQKVETMNFNETEVALNEQETTAIVNDLHRKRLGLLTWEEAKTLLHNGYSVRRLAHGPLAFVGYNGGKTISADEFWVEQNKKAAIRNGGSLVVKPYYTFCDGKSVDMAYRVNMEDELACDWIDASKNVFLVGIEQLENGNYICEYELLPSEMENGAGNLIPCYDLIVNQDTTKVAIISGSNSALMVSSILTDMKHKLFGAEAYATTEIVVGIEFPYDSNAVSVHVVEPSLNAAGNAYNLEALVVELGAMVNEIPGLSIVIDVKGIMGDYSFEDHDRFLNEERTLGFVNGIIGELQSNPMFTNTKWATVDLDLEVTQP